MGAPAQTAEVDPFELPEWLSAGQVTWTAGSSVRGADHVTGELGSPTGGLGCDLLAADHAYPQPLLGEDWRRRAHQSWTHGQVLVLEYDGRLTLAVPGTGFTADLVLECLARLARAVGAKPAGFTAAMRL